MAAHLQQPACYLQLRPRDIRVFPLAYLLRTDFLSLLATVRGTFQLTLVCLATADATSRKTTRKNMTSSINMCIHIIVSYDMTLSSEKQVHSYRVAAGCNLVSTESVKRSTESAV